MVELVKIEFEINWLFLFIAYLFMDYTNGMKYMN